MNSNKKRRFSFKPIRKRLKGLLGLVVFTLLVFSYYIYLDYLYFVDEVSEGDALRELRNEEKITIQVASSKMMMSQLKWFVSHYTECPCVHEIIILWTDQAAMHKPPLPNDFVYKHTHSKVTIVSAAPEFGITNIINYKSTSIATDAVMLLDLDVEISCDDLAFTHSVWRSGSNSFVGYFPRLHWRASMLSSRAPNIVSKLETFDSDLFIYGGPLSVWWRNAYSLMLPSGVMIHKKYLWEEDVIRIPSTAASHTSYVDINIASAWKRVLQMLSGAPHCTLLAFPLLATHLARADPPIWAAVPVHFHTEKTKNVLGEEASGDLKTREVGPPFATPLLSRDRAEWCLSQIYAELRLNATNGDGEIQYSIHKALKAKDSLFW